MFGDTNGLWAACVLPGTVPTIFPVWILFCEEGTQRSPGSYCDTWSQELTTMDHLPLVL